mmetsp:Transcript_14327/g.21073  ORF Transcript_14327/g.21073 Transcript_14327/m.21073 type:complete len:251 (+) Transcript_14327:476-1228(+)
MCEEETWKLYSGYSGLSGAAGDGQLLEAACQQDAGRVHRPDPTRSGAPTSQAVRDRRGGSAGHAQAAGSRWGGVRASTGQGVGACSVCQDTEALRGCVLPAERVPGAPQGEEAAGDQTRGLHPAPVQGRGGPGDLRGQPGRGGVPGGQPGRDGAEPVVVPGGVPPAPGPDGGGRGRPGVQVLRPGQAELPGAGAGGVCGELGVPGGLPEAVPAGGQGPGRQNRGKRRRQDRAPSPATAAAAAGEGHPHTC